MIIEPENPEVQRALDALAAQMAAEETPSRLEPVLMEAYRAHHRRRPVLNLRRRRVLNLRRRRVLNLRRRPVLQWIAGFGAGIAAGVVLLLAVSGRETPLDTMPPLRIAHAGPAPEWKPVAVAKAPVRRMPPTPRPKPEPEAPEEIASDFFRLRPGPLVEAGELAPMLRVQVPRYQMRRFGLPAGPDPWAAIDADVVLGRDGAPNAIRFVLTGSRATEGYR